MVQVEGCNGSSLSCGLPTSIPTHNNVCLTSNSVRPAEIHDYIHVLAFIQQMVTFRHTRHKGTLCITSTI